MIFQAKAVSDHYPIEMALKGRGPGKSSSESVVACSSSAAARVKSFFKKLWDEL